MYLKKKSIITNTQSKNNNFNNNILTIKNNNNNNNNNLIGNKINLGAANTVKLKIFGIIFCLFFLVCFFSFMLYFYIDIKNNDHALTNVTLIHMPINNLSMAHIHAFHQQKEKADVHGDCGVGWKWDENEALCIRNLLWPSVVDQDLINLSIDPCDDFYGFSCARYSDDPLNTDRDATFDYIQYQSDKIMSYIAQHIVETISPQESKFSAFYHSCLHHFKSFNDEEEDNNLVIRSLLTLIESNIHDYDDLYFVWGSLQNFQTILPLELTFEINPTNASQLLPFIKQSGIFTLPELVNSEAHRRDIQNALDKVMPAEQKKQWSNQIVHMEQALLEIWQESPAHNIIDYVSQSFFQQDLVYLDDYDDHLDFNLTLFLMGACPARSVLPEWQEALLHKHTLLWVRGKQYLDLLPAVIKRYSLKNWIQYTKYAVLFHLDHQSFHEVAYVKSYDVKYSLPWERPKFSAKEKDGEEEEKEKDIEKQCLVISKQFLMNLLDNYFVFQYLPLDLRNEVTLFAQHIQDEYASLLPEPFRSKLASIKFQIAVPDHWPLERTNLKMDAFQFDENILAIKKYHTERAFTFYMDHILNSVPFESSRLLDLPVSGGEAFFAHQLGLIVLNAGMIHPPLFSTLFDTPSRFARLGFLLAHELTHALDRIGIYFDAQGSFHPWLEGPALAAYLEKTQCLEEVYHTGGRTLNEDFADQMALTVSYQAFIKAYPDASYEEKRNFFIAFAQMFCAGPQSWIPHTHSTFENRVNKAIFQHRDELQAVFNCPLEKFQNKDLVCNLQF